MESTSLIARISEVFPLYPVPSKQGIIGETSYPPGESELVEIREFFGNRLWNTITPADVRRFEDCLALLSKEALAYFIAGWMTCCLLDSETVDVGLDNLVYQLERADPGLWSLAQRSVIYLWINHWIQQLPPSCPDEDFERVARRFRPESST